MGAKIEIDVDEIKKVFELFEQLQGFLHQPMNYHDLDIQSFAARIYPELHKAYYETVWNWLPQEVKKFYEER